MAERLPDEAEQEVEFLQKEHLQFMTHAQLREERQVIGEYAKEHGIAAAVEKFGASRERVYKSYMEAGGKPGDNYLRRNTPEKITEVAEYAKEHGISEAMRHFQISYYRVRVFCDMRNVDAKTSKRKKATVFQIIATLQSGVSGTLTAAKLGVSRQYVSQIKAQAIEGGVKFPGGDDG
jgi:hypothetical protein